MQLFVFAVAILSLSGFYCAPTDEIGRIVGGSQAALGEFPWIVSILESDSHICGGFIYNDRYIVTVASCVYDKTDLTKLKVKAGATSLITPSPNEQNIGVLSIVVHGSFNPTTKLNDLALILLSRPVVFTDTVKAIRYDEMDEMVKTGSIAGWGSTSDGSLSATRLYKTTVSNLMADCRFYGSNEYYPNYMICAGDQNSSPCTYDEGSPLVQVTAYGNVAIGIMSKVMACTSPYQPAIYTRLSSYYSWLLQNAGQQPA